MSNCQNKPTTGKSMDMQVQKRMLNNLVQIPISTIVFIAVRTEMRIIVQSVLL